MNERALPARRFAEDRHVSGGSAKRADVSLHPSQRGLLVRNPVIAGSLIRKLRPQRRMGKESERAETVVDGHDDDAALHELDRIVVIARAKQERAAVNPNHHRTRIIAPVIVGGIDVEEEAVLGHRRVAKGRERLWTIVAKLRRVLRGHWGYQRLGWPPSQRRGQRLGVSHSEELPHRAGRVELSLEGAIWRAYQRRRGEGRLKPDSEAKQQCSAERPS